MKGTPKAKIALVTTLIVAVTFSQFCWADCYRPGGPNHDENKGAKMECKSPPSSPLQPELQKAGQFPTTTGTHVNWLVFKNKTDSVCSGCTKSYKPNRNDERGNQVDPRIYSTYSPTAVSGFKTKLPSSKSGYYRPHGNDDLRDMGISCIRHNDVGYTVCYRPMSITVRTHSVCVTPPKDYLPQYKDGFYCYPGISYATNCRFGYWAFNCQRDFCRRSIFYYYGCYPYVLVTRVYYVDYPIIYICGNVHSSNYRETAQDTALNDIRNAWLNGRADLFDRHIREHDYIQVLLDGKYDYSITGADLLSMIRDAMTNIQTRSFVWEKISRRSSSYFVAYGRHRIVDLGGDVRTVYVSYGFAKYGGTFYIVEIGTSSTSL